MYTARNIKNQHNCLVLFQNLGSTPFIIFDTETTGIDFEKDYIVELAAIKYQIVDHTLKELKQIDLYIRPPKNMDEKVIAIHGISNEFLHNKPTETEVFSSIQDFFGEQPILVGHNIEFDVCMLQALYHRQNQKISIKILLDTLEMARDIIPYKNIKDYQLSTLCNFFHLESGLSFHCALDDVKATSRLLETAYHIYKESPKVPGTNRIHIKYLYYWKGYNMQQQGVYVASTIGLLYYNTRWKMWMSKDINLSEIDINDLEQQVLIRTNLATMGEFGRLTEKKFKNLKQKRKKEGVYL